MAKETSGRAMNWGDTESYLWFFTGKVTQSIEVGFGRAVMTTPPTSVKCLVCTLQHLTATDCHGLPTAMHPCLAHHPQENVRLRSNILENPFRANALLREASFLHLDLLVQFLT